MDAVTFIFVFLFYGLSDVQTVSSLDVTVSGQTYIELGVPYIVSCTVNEYRDSRRTDFKATLSQTNIKEFSIGFYKLYGCYHLTGSVNNLCNNASCSCDDNGLTTHWTYHPPLDLTSPVSFTCFSTDNNSYAVTSEQFQATIPYGPGSSLIFNTSSETLTKILGQEFSIVCSADCKPLCQFQWFKNTSVSTGATLHISKLAKDDDGTYTCRAENGYGKGAMKALNLTVIYGPHSVTLLPPDTQYTVTEGTTIPPINCKADCRPVCTYLWFGPNVTADSTNVLSLQNIQKNQRGVFSCTASNDVGSLKSSVVNIDVQFGPGLGVEFEPSATSVTKHVGDKLGPIHCSATCNPPCQYTWTKPDKTTINTAQLVVSSLSVEDHGPFICSASNGINGSQNKSLIVAVHYGPLSVTLLPPDKQYTMTEGNTIPPINCKADCRPVCTYLWSGPNVPVDSTNVLSLQNIQKNQKGVFSCTASNDVGSLKSSDVNIDVQFGPGLSVQFQPSATSVIKHKGDKLGPINCSATCNPPCQYTWTKPDKTTINTAQLVISSLYVEDHGPFICTASNGINGSQNKSLHVKVNYGPESVKLLPPSTQYFVTEGNTIPPVSCTAECRPMCNYTWSGPHVPTRTTNVLSLQNIQRNMRGVYNCQATNNGHIVKSSDVYLDVQFGPGSSLQFDPSDTPVTKEKGDQLGPIHCKAACNPSCQYKWTKPDKTIINDEELTIESLSIDDYGTFICTASNAIGGSQNKSLYITVNFKPFLDTTRSNSPEMIALSENEYLYITVSLKSNPHPIIKWTFIEQDNIDGCNNSSISSTSNNVGLHSSSNISIDSLKKNQFGQYTFMATNVVGIFRRKFSVFENKKPMSPSYVHVVCKSTTAIVIFKPMLIGNLPQELFIQYAEERLDMTSIKIHINDTNQPLEYLVTGLNPGRTYNFSILAVNPFGETRSNQVKCLTDTLSIGEDVLAFKEDNSSMFKAGIASLVIGLLFFVAATICIFRKRFQKTYTKSYKSDEYSDLQTTNPAFQDPYTSIQNPDESRHHLEPIANTYEECGKASDAAAYQNMGNLKSGHTKAEKNMGIYDNMKI